MTRDLTKVCYLDKVQEDVDVNGRDNIKIGVQAVVWGGTEWIALADDRDSWRALVNAVMNTRVPQNEGISGPVEKLLVCQDGLCSRRWLLC